MNTLVSILTSPWMYPVYAILGIIIVNVILSLLRFPLLKKPIGVSFELGFKKNFIPVLYIGKQKIREIRPSYKTESGAWRQCENGGIKLDFTIGTVKGPEGPFWKKEFRLNSDEGYVEKESKTNPWNSGNWAVVMELPYFPSMFISIIDFTGVGLVALIASGILLYLKGLVVSTVIVFLVGIILAFVAWLVKSEDVQPGLVFGGKSYEVNRISSQLKIYKPDRNDLFVFEEGTTTNYNHPTWIPVFTWTGEDFTHTWFTRHETGKSEQGYLFLSFTITMRGDMVDN
jgi:hypothetical protein